MPEPHALQAGPSTLAHALIPLLWFAILTSSQFVALTTHYARCGFRHHKGRCTDVLGSATTSMVRQKLNGSKLRRVSWDTPAVGSRSPLPSGSISSGARPS
jgi:hypothetical protein